MTESLIGVEYLTAYRAADAAAIGRLMMELGEKHTGEPLPEDLLREVIESPDREQLVALKDNKIVGSAVLHYMSTGTTRRTYLDNFVSERSVQGEGVGYALWLKIAEYCKERNTRYLQFSSNYDREKAHRFYKRQGAKIQPTAHFKMIFE